MNPKAAQSAIGIDIGSTSIKGVLLSEHGALLAAEKTSMRYLESSTDTPQQKEFNPNKVNSIIYKLIHTLISQGEKNNKRIVVKGISINGATGNALLLDKHKKPLDNAISWLDRRAARKSEGLLADIDSKEFHKIAGWPWRGSFTLALLAWLKKYESDLYSKANYPCMYIEYLIHKITDTWEIDTSNATLSFLQKQEKRSWHDPFCRLLDIEPSTRPKIKVTGEIIGEGNSGFIVETGLSKEAMIVHGSFDHPGAARAVNVISEEDILLSCGTSWVVFCPIQKRENALSLGLLIDPYLSPNGGPWGGMFSLSRIGTVIDNYINTVFSSAGKDKYIKFNQEAELAPPGANGLFLHLLDKREKQITEDEISHSEPFDIARALMEGPSFELYSNLKKLEQAGRQTKRIVLVGGPAESPIWPQIIGDITGLTIEIQEGQFTGALGAAKVAGTAVGLFDTPAANTQLLQRQVIHPDTHRHIMYQEIYEKYINDNE